MSWRVSIVVLLAIAVGHLAGDDLFAQRRRGIPFGRQLAAPKPEQFTVTERTEPPRKAADDGQPATLRGIVRDALGKRVAGASVWLVKWRNLEFDPSIETKTDAAGRFAFAEIDEDHVFGRESTMAATYNTTLIARDSEGRIGWHQLWQYADTRDCEVRLRGVTQLVGRVVDADGLPVVGARLTPDEFLAFPPGETRFLSDFAYLPPDFAAQYFAISGADGRFTMVGLPRCESMRCELTAGYVERAYVYLELGSEASIRIGRAGSIAGTIVLPEGEKPAPGRLRLQATLQPAAERLPWSPLWFSTSVAVDADGGFQFEALPPGRYTLACTGDDEYPYAAQPVTDVDLTEGQKVSGLTIPMKKLQQASGRVIDREDGHGIEAVEIVAMNQSGGVGRRVVKTDAQGHFSAWLLPERASLYIASVPEEYVPPSTYAISRQTADRTWPDTQLVRATAIEGKVVDAAGRAVPFARLGIDLAYERGQRRSCPRQCDRERQIQARAIAAR